MKALLADVRALEGMLETDVFETGVRRIGAEQEIFLIDDACRPKNMVLDMLPKLPPVGFTTELAQFNLETNLTPHEFGGDCMRRMETELKERLLQARTVAETLGGGIVMCGILPTLQKSHLGLDSMTPNPRYRRLNDAMSALRGGQFNFLIKGIDELETSHDNVISVVHDGQIHFQSRRRSSRASDLAQAITAPVLAAAVNSPSCRTALVRDAHRAVPAVGGHTQQDAAPARRGRARDVRHALRREVDHRDLPRRHRALPHAGGHGPR